MAFRPDWYDGLSEDERANAALIVGVVETSLLPEEDIGDVSTGGWVLAKRRAALAERPLRIVEDLPFALSMWCWWPFKAEMQADVREALQHARRIVFRGFYDESIAEERLSEIVPDAVLKQTFGELMQSLETGAIISRLKIPETR